MNFKPRPHPPFLGSFNQHLAEDHSIRPVGGGHQFSYRPKLGDEQLSPRRSSSSSSSAEESGGEVSEDEHAGKPTIQDDWKASGNDASTEGDLDGASEDSQGEDDQDADSHVMGSEPQPSVLITSSSVVCEFVIEDMDPMDSDCERLDVLLPTEIESMRSRSRSRQRGLDTGMMDDMRNLNCSNEASGNEALDNEEVDIDADVAAFHERQKELRRIRRVSMSSSFGKRTHSEISDSDDDTGPLDVSEAGASARRMRKRLHRGSLLFQDPPAPRIDELEEPNSSEDEFADEQTLAQELPYWKMEIMEMDSS